MIVPLRSKRAERAQLLQKFQHLGPAVILLGSGFQTLRGDRQGIALWIALFQIASSVLLLATMGQAVHSAARRADADAAVHHAHHGVSWIEIFTAAVLAAEAWEHYHATNHIKRPTVLLAVTLLVLGLLHPKILTRARRRGTLRVEDEGLYVGARPFRRSIRATWDDVASIDVGDRYGTITLKNGRKRKLDLQDLDGSNHVRAALAAAQERVVTVGRAS